MNGFKVLERQPQALTRLAHESVQDEDSGGEYLEFLDYSLQTSHEGHNAPILYSIKVEGINDLRKEGISSVKQENSADSSQNKNSEKIDTEASNLDGTTSAINQENTTHNGTTTKEKELKLVQQERIRPILLARFTTAKYLLLLEVIKELYITPTPEQYYSKFYKTLVSKRKASLTISARLLDREGKILWIKEITGSYEDKFASEQTDEETVIPVTKLYKRKISIEKKALQEHYKDERNERNERNERTKQPPAKSRWV